MSESLHVLNMTSDTVPSSSVLAKVQETPSVSLHLDEKIAVRTAHGISARIDYVLFRRFGEHRSSQVVAYILTTDENNPLSSKEISSLHHSLWLSGQTPLLYVASPAKVDIYACLCAPKKDENQEWVPTIIDSIKLAGEVSNELRKEQIKRFSSYSLINGTFWEDSRNTPFITSDKAAHQALIAEVVYAYDKLDGANNPAKRHLLLLTLLLKYLEDRGVFEEYTKGDSRERGKWFKQFHQDAHSCLEVFKFGGKNASIEMFLALKEKFNGDIFKINAEEWNSVTDDTISQLLNLIWKDLHTKSGQFYLWEYYSFEHIPVEVLSHIYQHFTDRDQGAIYTPPMAVNLILDQIMPLNDSLSGHEKILDPTCGSGVFLVSAFRRLVHVWSEKNGWRRPEPEELSTLLKKCIFGIELQPQAAELTAFSLALAVCDALRPEIIWEKLQFEDLIGKNIFSTDYCISIDTIKNVVTSNKGFDIIIGNPPFKTKDLTPEMEKRAKRDDYMPPQKEKANFFLMDCAINALAENGKLCLLQPSNILYNASGDRFRKKLFSRFKIDLILDFASIRGFFEDADTKAVALLISKTTPSNEHFILHWTFRRTASTDQRITFELDRYDYHVVPQEIAVSTRLVWRANLAGGGRMFHLVNSLIKLPTLLDFVNKHKWIFGVGNKSGKDESSWNDGQLFLPTEAFNECGIDYSKLKRLSITPKEPIGDIRKSKLFKAPLFLIKENDMLPCAFWDQEDIAYKGSIIGIHAPQNESTDLYNFYSAFLKNRKLLKAACYLLGSRAFVSRATSLNKTDIECLPWPEDGNWSLAIWEQELLSDLEDYIAEFVRKGQNSIALSTKASSEDLKIYSDTFLRLMHNVYPSMAVSDSLSIDGLHLHVFSFHGNTNIDELYQGDWVKHAIDIIYSQQGDSQSFSSIRLLRYYDGDLLIIIKPDRLRYWLRSVAVQDADDVLMDFLHGDEQYA